MTSNGWTLRLRNEPISNADKHDTFRWQSVVAGFVKVTRLALLPKGCTVGAVVIPRWPGLATISQKI